eukprot:12148734-Alexandrium_andersonii.AAC.1
MPPLVLLESWVQCWGDCARAQFSWRLAQASWAQRLSRHLGIQAYRLKRLNCLSLLLGRRPSVK